MNQTEVAMKVWLAAILIAPLIVALFLATRFFAEIEDYRAIDWLSITGTFFGYYGVVFSAYAALGVREISNRYFAKMRLPEIRKQIESLASRLSILAESTTDKAVSDRIFSEITVALESLKKIDGYRRSKLIDQSLTHTSKVLTWVQSNRSTPLKVTLCDDLWPLYANLNTMNSQIMTAIEEERAR